MSVRKRTWVTAAGQSCEAWIANYSDASGARRIATFERKRDADAYEAEVRSAVRAGIHTAPSVSPTVAEAAQNLAGLYQIEG